MLAFALLSLTVIVRSAAIGGVSCSNEGDDLQCALQMPAAPAPAAVIQAEDPPPSFLAVGDQGCSFDPSDSTMKRLDAVAAAMAEIAAELNPNHISGVGDNVYNNGAEGNESRIKQVWFDKFPGAHQSLKRPWHMVLGNHDWRTNPWTEVNFTTSSLNEGGLWNEPGLWYKKSMAGKGMTMDFFYIDTMIWTGSAANYFDHNFLGSNFEEKQQEQKDWVLQGLKDSTADWKIVIGHHVMYSDSRHSSEAFFDMKDLNQWLQNYGVAFYMNGHNHNQEVVQDSGVTYVTSGNGCKVYTEEYCKTWNSQTCKYRLPSETAKKFVNIWGGFAAVKFLSKDTAELVVYGNSSNILFSTKVQNPKPNPSVTSRAVVPTTAAERWQIAKLRGVCGMVPVKNAAECCGEDCCRAIPDMSVDRTCKDFCAANNLSCVAAFTTDEAEDDGPCVSGGPGSPNDLGCSVTLGAAASGPSDLVCNCEASE